MYKFKLYIRNLQRLVNIIGGTSLDALVGLALDVSADYLDYLNDHHGQQYADPGDVAVASLVAVDDGYLTKAGAADGCGHCGVTKDGDHGDHSTVDKGGLGFGQEHAGDDLEVGAAHGLSGFDNACADFLDGRFNHTPDIGCGGDNHIVG